MLAELFEHDHRQQARARPSSWNDVEGRRRLADLFPHRLDHLAPTGLRLKRPRHILAELAQAMAAAALARRRRIDHHALSGKMVGERIAFGTFARKSAHVGRLGDGLFRRQFVLRGGGLSLFERKRQINQALRALRLLSVNLAFQLGDPQLLLRDQRFACFGPRHRQFRRSLKGLRALDAAIAADGAPAWMRTRASFNSTSITADPEQLDDVDEEGAAGAGSMTTGANPWVSAPAAWRISRRHLKTRLGQTSSRRATSAITASGSEIAARIRARSSSLHRRRRSAPDITVILPMLRS